MAGVNRVTLIGNLGSEPEVKNLDSGKKVARMRIATTESYKNKQGNKVTATEWHEIELWEGLAKIAEEYLKKGDMVYIEGSIKSDNWTDEHGQNRKSFRIRATSLNMLPNGKRNKDS